MVKNVFYQHTFFYFCKIVYDPITKRGKTSKKNNQKGPDEQYKQLKRHCELFCGGVLQ